MAGRFRVNLMQGACRNAQALIPSKIYREIEKWATKDKKAKSHFFREWILAGVEQERMSRMVEKVTAPTVKETTE